MEWMKRLLAVALTTAALCAPPFASFATPVAGAAPCPDVEVVFARGTTEAPGVGGIGQPFVDSVKALAAPRSVGVYAVNYPASDQFGPSMQAGTADARAHIESMAANCPNTRMVLGGYSQGAAVMDYATNDAAPGVADHVAALALFGVPRTAFARQLIGTALPAIAPPYYDKVIDLCVPLDPVCFEGGFLTFSHTLYATTGMTQQAAEFAVSKL